MKLGIVGPTDPMMERTCGIIQNGFPGTEIVLLKYETFAESAEIARCNQKNVDALLFLGKTPYRVAQAAVTPEIPWEYIPRHGGTLLRALLEASQIMHCEIKNISIDTYEEDLIYEVYGEIGLKKENITIFVAEQKLTEENYFQYLCEFHKKNYEQYRVGCCITGITEIYRFLNQAHIPCIRTLATANVIRLTFGKLEQKYLAQRNQNSQIVVMVVGVSTFQSSLMEWYDEYLYTLQRNKVLEKIHLFASKIEAAVAENGDGEFLIFTTRKVLESETNDLRDIYLLDMLMEVTGKEINIGIGYGESVRKAKQNAYQGIGKAVKAGGNTGFAVYECGETRGPLRCGKQQEIKIGLDLMAMSKEAKIGTNTLFKIYKAVIQSPEKEFTSKELATLCGIGSRNMNRIIQKLENAMYCQIVGDRIMESGGRPSRIIRFTKF